MTCVILMSFVMTTGLSWFFFAAADRSSATICVATACVCVGEERER